jgi:ABC-type uncharacterized transport system permease subunit
MASYVAAAYGVFIALIAVYVTLIVLRLTRTARRLRAYDDEPRA